MKRSGESGGCRTCFQHFARLDELVAIHGHCYFETIRRRLFALLTTQYFSQATDANRRRAAGQRNEIFNPLSDFNFIIGEEAHAARADVAGLYRPVYTLLPYLQNVQGQV